MTLKGKRIAVLVAERYQELELWYPYYRFQEAGAEVELVGSTKDTFDSKGGGYPATATKSIDEIRAEDFDAVIIPGGFGPDVIRRDPRMTKFVRDIDAAGKPVGAICHGAWVLVSAKILKGRTLTSLFAIQDDVNNAGGTWLEDRVVVDDNLVTAQTPPDIPRWSAELFKAFERYDARVREKEEAPALGD